MEFGVIKDIYSLTTTRIPEVGSQGIMVSTFFQRPPYFQEFIHCSWKQMQVNLGGLSLYWMRSVHTLKQSKALTAFSMGKGGYEARRYCWGLQRVSFLNTNYYGRGEDDRKESNWLTVWITSSFFKNKRLSMSTWVGTRSAVVWQSIHEQENGYKLYLSKEA